MTKIESNVQVMRLIQSALIAAVPLCALLAEVGRGHGSGRWTSPHWLMSGLLYGASPQDFVIAVVEYRLPACIWQMMPQIPRPSDDSESLPIPIEMLRPAGTRETLG
jgi:hypothetical protein